jgi:lactate dehydrogenase-like 2-hydroxyacid dehydrogenase
VRILFVDWRFEHEPDLEREVAGPQAVFDVHRNTNLATVAEATWRECDAIVTSYAKLKGPEILDRLARCKVILRSGVGFDNVDIAGCAERGIAVCNVPDYGTTEVADHAIALMLAFKRGIVTYHNAIAADRVGGWWHLKAPLVKRLRGARFGVVGLGRIGNAAARRAQAFDMEVAFYDPHLPDGTELGVGYVRVASLEELMATSDVVSLHCPLSEDTDKLIGAKAIAAAKPGLVLVNTARGPIVDLDAVYEGLKSGKLGAAGLDVLPEEPPKAAHKLFEALKAGEPWLEGRLILSPHAAWWSAAGFADQRRKGMTTVANALAHGKLRNCVNAHLLGNKWRGTKVR